MFVVFDLDGTLADITHRLHHIKDGNRNWDTFHRDCVHDAVIPEMKKVFQSLRGAGCRIEVWSGRSDMVMFETQKWLFDHNLFPNLIRMRKHGDYTPDDELKESWLLSLDPAERPSLVFDDRQRIVDMWRRYNIRCCQVALGDF